MLGFVQLLAIEIHMNPKIADFGPFELTWHGVFTAIGIALGVYLGARIGQKLGFTEDDAYSIALVGVPAGIIGARAMFVLENRDRFEGQWMDVFRINEGGITVYGAVIGGVLGSVAYGAIRRMPIMRGLDAAGFGLLLGMAVGRIGDLINGEHWSKVSDLPWAVVYTHPDSPGFSALPGGGGIATHPASTYEMIGDFLIIGIMALIFAKFWKTRPGLTFFTGVALYGAMRFGVTYLRVDSCGPILAGNLAEALELCPHYVVKDWLVFPQVVSIVTFAVGVVGIAYALLRAPSTEPRPATLTQPTPATPQRA